ncbi:MAG: glycosyltransferase [Verrucomicrobiota bacterium]
MTASYSIPDPISASVRFRSKPVNARAIKAIIPTYKDWDGLRVTLDSLLNLKTPPKEIEVANDNVEPGVPDWLSAYPVKVVDYAGNLGPARARNRAFGLNDDDQNYHFLKLMSVFSERQSLPDYLKNGICSELKHQSHPGAPTTFEWASAIDWYYFTDCGCVHEPDLFLKFEETWRECGDCCVAISGPVTGSGSGPINEYMTEQGVLNPPLERTIHGVYLPQAIVTANALIAGLPFAFLGGFDPQFQEAAGEDLDMGIRLRQLGVIAWSPAARVSHQFDENESDFYRRFRRYGRGNRKLEVKHGLPSLRARPFLPEKPEHQHLAGTALKAMQAGYDEAIDVAERGILKVIPV